MIAMKASQVTTSDNDQLMTQFEQFSKAQEKASYPKPLMGQVWMEKDKRFFRLVSVVGFEGDKVQIYRDGRITRAKLSRFNGKSGGYAFYDHGICAYNGGQTAEEYRSHMEKTF